MFHHPLYKFAILTLVATASWASPTVTPFTVSPGGSYTVYFNGIGGNPVSVIPGLTSSVTFSNFTFTAGGLNNVNGYDYTGLTNVTFDMELSNTSSAPITASRLTAIGFITNPSIATEVGSIEKNNKGESKSTIDPNSVTNTFTNVDYGSTFPNQLGNVEFCFSDSNNCPGGGNGGVKNGETGNAQASLWFTGTSLTELNFQDLYVRYQSVVGCTNNCGGSATGTVVPEPSFYGLTSIGMGALVWFSYRRRQQA